MIFNPEDDATRRDLNAAIAREVFGWVVEHMPQYGPDYRWVMRRGERLSTLVSSTQEGLSWQLPAFSRDIDEAWEVVECFMDRDMGYTFGSGTWPDGKRYHTARFFTAPWFFADDQRKVGTGDGETLPLAICRAALAFLGAE